MRIKNVSSSKLIISDLPGATSGLGGLVVQPNEEELLYNEDAEKSAELKSFIDGGQITVLNQLEEPSTGTSVADATSEAATGIPGSDGITDTIAAPKATGAGEVLTASAAGIAGWAAPAAPSAHDLGGAEHNADTLANLNTKISDATLVDTGDARFSDARTPTAHDLAGAEHNSATLAQLNAKISDATLVDTGDARFSDARTPTAQSVDGAAAGNVADANVVGGMLVIHRIDIADGVSADTDVVLTHKERIFDVTVVKTGAAGGASDTIQVKNGATPITDVIDINVADKIKKGNAELDDAAQDIAAAGTLRVSMVKSSAANTACTVYVSAMRVA